MKAGITGHQDLGDPATVTWVRDTLARLVVEHKVSKGFTCLAKGADQLFAAVLTAKGLPFTAIIPCRGYEKAFADVVNFAHQAGKTVVHVDPVTHETTIV